MKGEKRCYFYGILRIPKWKATRGLKKIVREFKNIYMPWTQSTIFFLPLKDRFTPTRCSLQKIQGVQLQEKLPSNSLRLSQTLGWCDGTARMCRSYKVVMRERQGKGGGGGKKYVLAIVE